MINVTVGNNLHRATVIVPEDTTIRTILENNEIDYTVGMTSLDGATLAPGDMDKTLAQMGITEKCYLLNVVKADNAAKIKIVGRSCVIESGETLENIKVISKYRNNALTLFSGEGSEKKPVFSVAVSKNGKGSINKYGAEFGVDASKDGKAIITLDIPDGVVDTKKWAEETVGVSILMLNKTEAQFANAIEDVKAEMQNVRENIEVVM